MPHPDYSDTIGVCFIVYFPECSKHFFSGWWQYDERTSQDIEEAYRRPERFCTILVAGYVYVVDFEEMVQQRQNDPSRKRQVKRDLATTAKKGVAGLRLDGSTADPTNSTTPLNQSAASHSPLPLLVTNNLISTIAATDAAISIANDIIDSTLAHASPDRVTVRLDDVPDSRSANNSNISNSSSGSSVSSRQDLLQEVEETLNISSAASVAENAFNGLNGGPIVSGNAARLDFFSQTIDEFRSLALNNMAESSSDSDTDNEDGADEAAQQTETELL